MSKFFHCRLQKYVVLAGLAIIFSASAYADSQGQATAQVERQTGIRLYRENRYDEAVEVLKKAVSIDKGDYEAWQFLGLSLTRKKQLKEATKCFETVLKLRPQFAGGHAGLAYVLLLRNKEKSAAAEAESTLKIDPKNVDGYYILGTVRLREGARDDALKNAEQAIHINPEFAPPYLLKSQALVSFVGDVLLSTKDELAESRTGRYREAAEALEKYLQLNPNAPNKDVWTEQLESLRFAIGAVNDGDRTVSSKEVTALARVLSKPEPAYTTEARKNGVTETVVLRAVFTSDGNVKHILVIKRLPDGLTEMAIAAARKIKFVPATKDGKPVSMWMQLEYNFNLF